MNRVDEQAAAAGAMLAALSKHAFVAGMERRLVELLADCAHVVCYAAGALISKGDEGRDSTYLLTQGEVELETRVADGHVSSVRRLGAGDVLRVEDVAERDSTRDMRAVGAVSAIALDNAALKQKMVQDAELRPALRMCTVRYDRIHEQGEHPKGEHPSR